MPVNLEPIEPGEKAFRVVLAHRTMLKTYICTMVRDPELAEDAFSDVTVQIVRSWDTFDQRTSFAPWARTIARRVAWQYRKQEIRRLDLLSDEAIEGLAQEMDLVADELELGRRMRALEECVKSLSKKQRRFVQLRYFENRSCGEIAELAGRTAESVYVTFSRLHSVLLECVERKVASL